MVDLKDLKAPVEPTEAEVRATRISLGKEALARIQKFTACPLCGRMDLPSMRAAVEAVAQGYDALETTAKAQHEALKKLKGEAKR